RRPPLPAAPHRGGGDPAGGHPEPGPPGHRRAALPGARRQRGGARPGLGPGRPPRPGRRLRDPRRPPRPGPAPLPRGRPPRGRDPLADRLSSAPRPPARAGTHLGPVGTPFDGASEPAPPDVASPPPRE